MKKIYYMPQQLDELPVRSHLRCQYDVENNWVVTYTKVWDNRFIWPKAKWVVWPHIGDESKFAFYSSERMFDEYWQIIDDN
jgi:hypothetical protein